MGSNNRTPRGLGSHIYHVAAQPDGDIVVASNKSDGTAFGTIHILSGTNLQVIIDEVTLFGTIYDMVVKPNGDVVVAGSGGDNSVWIRSGTDLENCIASNSNLPNIKGISLLSNGDIVCGTSTGLLYILHDNGQGHLDAVGTQHSGYGPVTDVAVMSFPGPAGNEDWEEVESTSSIGGTVFMNDIRSCLESFRVLRLLGSSGTRASILHI